MKRILVTLLLTVTLVSVGAAQGGDPDVPEKYIKVDEVKAMLDLKKRVTFIDVRDRDQFQELHIRGAVNIPLRELHGRLGEVPRQGSVVLY
ncbi:MAG TPA: rhodanese-like domain-containing protein [Methylomirabilota bacterium]|nr:rhodanese-like domain-containing protein [Methylomirabilota bacterium]